MSVLISSATGTMRIATNGMTPMGRVGHVYTLFMISNFGIARNIWDDLIFQSSLSMGYWDVQPRFAGTFLWGG